MAPAKRVAAKGATSKVARARRVAARGKAPSRKLARPAPTRAYVGAVWKRLAALYPDAHCELDHQSPWQLLVATILSAQCTDKRVNLVTPQLFAAYPTPGDLAVAPLEDVERVIKSTGFFRAKARSLVGAAAALVGSHNAAVPNQMEQLVVLPGVGRKTANVVLGNAFGINDGMVVDTHVSRLAQRLGLTRETDPLKIERDLMALFPRERWTLLAHLLIWHGRRICEARKPRCAECSLQTICPASSV